LLNLECRINPALIHHCDVDVEHCEDDQACSEPQVGVKRLSEGLADTEGHTDDYVLVEGNEEH
jgi:hypothetical protein